MTTCTLYSHSTSVPDLIKQKRALIRAIERAETTTPRDVELLEGLLNLLDHIHDALLPPK